MQILLLLTSYKMCCTKKTASLLFFNPSRSWNNGNTKNDNHAWNHMTCKQWTEAQTEATLKLSKAALATNNKTDNVYDN